jgi:hypothetical protein
MKSASKAITNNKDTELTLILDSIACLRIRSNSIPTQGFSWSCLIQQSQYSKLDELTKEVEKVPTYCQGIVTTVRQKGTGKHMDCSKVCIP